MIKIQILDWDKPSTKIVITVFTALLVISSYFIVFSYYSYLRDSEKQTLSRLGAISKTLVNHVNGDTHYRICSKYKTPGLLKSNNSDSDYYSIHKVLKDAFSANGLESEISTLVWNPQTNIFNYIVNSTDTPYVRDPYKDYLPEFKYAYEKDTVIHKYEDEFGTWLTALSPIKNSKGKSVGILEVDMRFDAFIKEARKGMLKNLAFSLIIFAVTVIVLLRYIRIILNSEEKSKKQIETSAHEIAHKNKEILDSINYARRIQNAILPPREEVFSCLKNAFILYKPKDIVSGDFYFFTKTQNRYIIAAADCTGHGVPGALMSMIGNDLLHQIIREMKVETPAKVLDHLHMGVTSILKQDTQRDSRDGMDIAMLSFSHDMKLLEYAGAYRSLFLVRNDEVKEFKANKFPIGNNQHERSHFNNNEVQIQKNDMLYIFTDGYADQFGGPKGKKFMMKNFQQLLSKISSLSVTEQESVLSDTIDNWRGEHEQVDDILVIGIRV
ncbi:MAG: SpoIIE family protein phosphatase [Bacteroidota bacterium]|jgi:serine phosphatase RsbU (regulator of sigma subunit)